MLIASHPTWHSAGTRVSQVLVVGFSSGYLEPELDPGPRCGTLWEGTGIGVRGG